MTEQMNNPLAKTNNPSNREAEINFYVCGGTGINIGNALRTNAKTTNVKIANFIGLDSSGNNSRNVSFPIERMLVEGSSTELASGSGKKQVHNYAQADGFLNRVLTNHKPNRFNVVVANTSGGTGSILSLLLMRKLIEADQLVVMCLVNDFTSQVEMKNAVNSMSSLANQTKPEQLDVSIPYLSFNNTADRTRGEVNADIVDRLNILSVFLTEHNEEQDYEDLKSLFAYSRNYNVPAALSRISFYKQDAAESYSGTTPVAVSSLFCNRDDIISRFEGCVIRSTGVFNPEIQRPNDTDELHMTLDHGEALVELEKRIEALEDRESINKQTFVKQREVKNSGNDLGIVL